MSILVWAGFLVLVSVLVALDLGVINRGDHAMSAKKGLAWTVVWIAVALSFSGFIYLAFDANWFGLGLPRGDQPALSGVKALQQYVTAWILEYSLSVDNLFVIAVIFSSLAIPAKFQHRVLFWGILSAVIMRGVLILAGVELVNRFYWVTYFFALILLISAIKLLTSHEGEVDPQKSMVVRAFKRVYPLSHECDGHNFFTRVNGVRTATPLLVALLMVESADLVFAVDSIPAVIGVTKDPFIAFTSNVFAIFGLRSLYFALAGLNNKFRYVKVSLAVLLVYISVKMSIEHYYEVYTVTTLTVIAVLLGGVLASVIADKRQLKTGESDKGAPLGEDVDYIARTTLRRARQLIVFVVGLTIIALSIPIGLLPGPGGIAAFAVGMLVLASEFIWARRLLNRAKSEGASLAARADRLLTHKPRPWLIPPVIIAAVGALFLALHLTDYHKVPLVLMIAVGPFSAIGVWAYRTIARQRELRRAKAEPPAGAPAQQVEAAPPSATTARHE